MTRSDGQSWRDRAACIDVDPAVFFPTRVEDITEAQAVCAGCPVQTDCLDFALRRNVVGVWGGRSERTRRHLRRQLRITTVDTDIDALLFTDPEEGPCDDPAA